LCQWFYHRYLYADCVEGTNSLVASTGSGRINTHSEMSSLVSNVVIIMSEDFSNSTLRVANANRGE
jgi:hypothetical protein